MQPNRWIPMAMAWATTPILMTISVSGRSMDLNGVVVYTDPGHGVGVRFKDVAAEDLDFLRGELELTS